MAASRRPCDWIVMLNANARARWNGEEGEEALAACEAVARVNDLTEVKEEGSCRIYRTPDGHLLNLWIEGVQSERIEDGGLGFDDQIEWAQ